MTAPPRSPAATFLLVALPAGLLLLVLTPPFQVPDESAHLLRAYQVAEGRLLAEVSGGLPGGTLPVSLAAAAGPFPPGMPATPRAELIARVKTGLAEPLAPLERRFTPFASASYSSVPYLPAAVAIAAGKASSWSPLALLYAGRLATLIAAALLHAFAVRAAPAFRGSLALLALTPMAAFQRSGLSADGVTNGLAFLFFGLVLKLSERGENPPSAGTKALVVATSVALALCKGYVLLLPLLLLVPSSVPAKRRLAWGTVFLGAFAALGWSLAIRRLPVPPRIDVPVDAAVQLRTLTTRPGVFLSALGSDLSAHGARYGRELVGQLGWLDVRLPAVLLLTIAASLLVLAAADAHGGLRLARRWRLGTLSILALGVISIFGAMFVLHTPAASAGIEGVQGRYFIPLAPPALFLLVSRRPFIALSDRTLARVTLLAALLGVAGSAWALHARYVAPRASAFRLLQSGGCPPFPPSPSSSISS